MLRRPCLAFAFETGRGRGGGRRPLCPFFAWLDEHAKKEGGREPLMTTQPRALSSSGAPFTPLLVKKCDRGKAFRVSAAAEGRRRREERGV